MDAATASVQAGGPETAPAHTEAPEVVPEPSHGSAGAAPCAPPPAVEVLPAPRPGWPADAERA
eukprot:1923984-Alexandrium_andersonii.AAC.1